MITIKKTTNNDTKKLEEVLNRNMYIQHQLKAWLEDTCFDLELHPADFIASIRVELNPDVD